MAGIPIIISSSESHSHSATNSPRYPFADSLSEHPHTTSHATQTDIEDDPPTSLVRKSPINSRSTSLSRKPLHQTWADQIRIRLSSPHSHHNHHQQGAVDPSGRPLLAAPAVETPKRPATPSADFYKGQAEENFGMTFENRENVHMRKAKPTPCAFSYEDQKHRMTMDWLERRGTW